MNEIIENVGNAIFEANIDYAERCANDKEEYSDDGWANNQAKAAIDAYLTKLIEKIKDSYSSESDDYLIEYLEAEQKLLEEG